MLAGDGHAAGWAQAAPLRPLIGVPSVRPAARRADAQTPENDVSGSLANLPPRPMN